MRRRDLFKRLGAVAAVVAVAPAAKAEASEILSCTRCGDPITDGYMIGDGNGMGRRFAHPPCYREREVPKIRIEDRTDA